MKLEEMERHYDEIFSGHKDEPLVQSTKTLMCNAYNNGLHEGKEKGFNKGFFIGEICAVSGMFLGLVIKNNVRFNK